MEGRVRIKTENRDALKFIPPQFAPPVVAQRRPERLFT
jgi:hypothetical protein